MARYLGVDVGGTNTKCALLDVADGGQRHRGLGATPTVVNDGPTGVQRSVIDLIARHASHHGPFDAIGVTVPGTVDVAAGTTGVVPNIAGHWAGFSMAGPIAAATGMPVYLLNDARAFALAEARVGAASGLGTVVCLTLGTGIGGGVVMRGELQGGHTGMAGEIGHQTLDPRPDAPECGCGNRGCLEALTRADVLCRRAAEPSVEAVFAAARAGGRRATAALRSEIGYLAIGLANAYMLLGPDAFVVGGGIAQAGAELIDPLLVEVRRRVTLDDPDAIDIRLAELGQGAGAIGAALWAMGRVNASPTHQGAGLGERVCVRATAPAGAPSGT